MEGGNHSCDKSWIKFVKKQACRLKSGKLFHGIQQQRAGDRKYM